MIEYIIAWGIILICLFSPLLIYIFRDYLDEYNSDGYSLRELKEEFDWDPDEFDDPDDDDDSLFDEEED